MTLLAVLAFTFARQMAHSKVDSLKIVEAETHSDIAVLKQLPLIDRASADRPDLDVDTSPAHCIGHSEFEHYPDLADIAVLNQLPSIDRASADRPDLDADTFTAPCAEDTEFKNCPSEGLLVEIELNDFPLDSLRKSANYCKALVITYSPAIDHCLSEREKRITAFTDGYGFLSPMISYNLHADLF